MAAAIELMNLTVGFSDRAVIDGFSAAVDVGRLVAIIGPNGAGKSTLVRAMAGLVPVRAGRVRIGELDPHQCARRTLAKQLAYVPQRYELGFPFTVAEVVLMGRYAWSRGLGPDRDDERARAEQALAAVELTALAHRRFDELSGGEQRRVLLAQAWCQAAPVTVLDEPTAALDPAHARDVFERLRAHVAGGATAVVVTHDLNLALRYADELWVIADGRLRQRGDARAVLATGVLSEVFAVKWHIGEVDAQPFVVAR